MGKPIRIFKKLQFWGNSKGVVIPKCWFQMKGNDCIIDVVLEITKEKIVIRPY